MRKLRLFWGRDANVENAHLIGAIHELLAKMREVCDGQVILAKALAGARAQPQNRINCLTAFLPPHKGKVGELRANGVAVSEAL